MADIFIYTGLAIMLIASIYGIVVAVKGYRSHLRDSPGRSATASFLLGTVTPKMKRPIIIWAIGIITGLLITGIGTAIGLR